jgi:hypothetical protein
MDNVVETVVWVVLLGATGIVLLIQLPRIVIGCLELVERFQKMRFHKKRLFGRYVHADESALHSQDGPPHT